MGITKARHKLPPVQINFVELKMKKRSFYNSKVTYNKTERYEQTKHLPNLLPSNYRELVKVNRQTGRQTDGGVIKPTLERDK